MDITFLYYCLPILVGVAFFQVENKEERHASHYLNKNPFGCVLNIIAYLGGLFPVLIFLIRASINSHWWFFLLILPGLFLGGIISALISFFIPKGIESGGFDEQTTRLGIKRQIGALIIVCTYVIYYFFS